MIYRSKKAWWSAFLFVGPSLVCMIVGVVVIVFYLSFVLSPVAGVVGGLWGTRVGEGPAESNNRASEAACYDAGKGQRGAEE